MTDTRRPIGILCALPQEQALLLDAMGSPPPLPGIGLDARRGVLDGIDAVVAESGVGKVQAAATAALLADRVHPRALVFSGVAGGLSDRLGIGDIVVADTVIDIDYGRLTPDGHITYQPGTLPIPEVEPDPGFRMERGLRERIEFRLEGRRPRAVLGTVLTTDGYLAEPTRRDALAERWDGLAVEMEGAALCGVAERFGIPWLVVRALSDRAGEDSLDDFNAFLDSAAAASAALVRELLPTLDG